jgi:hypothetical protein
MLRWKLPLCTVALAGTLFLAAPAQESQKQDQKESLVGCLTRGAMPGEFILTEEKSGDRIVVTGSEDLDKHAENHKLKLMGTRTNEKGKTVFRVAMVEHISDSCTTGSDGSR